MSESEAEPEAIFVAIGVERAVESRRWCAAKYLNIFIEPCVRATVTRCECGSKRTNRQIQICSPGCPGPFIRVSFKLLSDALKTVHNEATERI